MKAATTSGIASWPEEERPRERLLSRGPEALTDAELIAILLRVGFKGTSAVELARQLLQRFGSLRAMVQSPVTALLDVKGLKGAKAAQLLAAVEICRRVSVPNKRDLFVVKSTAAASDYFRDRLRGLSEEHFRVLYLNRRGALLDDVLIAKGAVDSVMPHLRIILGRALQVNATSLIAGHNHPSGSSKPSKSDRLLTRELVRAARPLAVRVVDHLIIGEDSVFSFAENGLLESVVD